MTRSTWFAVSHAQNDYQKGTCMFGMNIWQLGLTAFLLIGFSVPFIQIEHARHARAFMCMLIALTALFVVLYEILRIQQHLPQADHVEQVFPRAYVLSAALCGVVEEVLGMRDESRTFRPILLGVYCAFFLLSLISLLISMFS